jgi:hypothetical protein
MKTRHGWDTAVDLQADLVHSFLTREGRVYLDMVGEHMAKAASFDSRTGELVADRNSNYTSELVNTAAARLPDAEPFFVNDELSAVIDHAAAKFRPEPLLRSDLIVPSGFAYFDRPLFIVDDHSVVSPYRAVQWTLASDLPGAPGSHPDPSVATGILYAMYQDCNDPDPYAEKNGRIGPVGGSTLALSYVTGIRFDGAIAHLGDNASLRDMFSHLKTFFRLCQQTIAVPSYGRVSRTVYKRAVRKWKPVSEIVVFTLRRAKSPRYEGDERVVDWSHRWIVGGFWRQQWYPSEQVHRQIYINDFIKGPKDKPIIYKRRVFELVR